MVKIVEIGQTIGHVACDGCGTEVAVKVGSSGSVFTYCQHVVGERDGKKEKCYTRRTFGRTASERLKAEYLEQEAINVQLEQQKEEGGTPAATGAKDGTAGKDTSERRGLLGAVAHFITN